MAVRAAGSSGGGHGLQQDERRLENRDVALQAVEPGGLFRRVRSTEDTEPGELRLGRPQSAPSKR